MLLRYFCDISHKTFDSSLLLSYVTKSSQSFKIHNLFFLISFTTWVNKYNFLLNLLKKLFWQQCSLKILSSKLLTRIPKIIKITFEMGCDVVDKISQKNNFNLSSKLNLFIKHCHEKCSWSFWNFYKQTCSQMKKNNQIKSYRVATEDWLLLSLLFAFINKPFHWWAFYAQKQKNFFTRNKTWLTKKLSNLLTNKTWFLSNTKVARCYL